ncbi:MAG TPA: HlyD family efflux transporter periplasmic adaptor subunit [Tepidisphaeraceae bacterium]|jgi:multidrug efflux pump subunit AcrA (membrane-fusion protein)|nr:HlyD family efflux transporter periplasmic adaptor subunit [Tepidisphaeraceae bacterium]
MESSRAISNILKFWVLLLVAGALYYIWKDRAAAPLENDVEQAEEIAHTDVAVRIGTIKQMTLHGYVVGYGNVAPEPATADKPAADARITVAWPAVISEVRCIEGQHVEKGQPLFVIDQNILSNEIDRARRLLGVTRPTGQSDGNEIVMTSPISGTVQMLEIHPGEIALPTITAVEVVNTDRLVITVGVPAWQAASILPGQQASIEFPADPTFPASPPISSTVERIDPSVDPKTNLATVDVAIPAGRGIRPGQFGRVAITSRSRPDCLVVPADSIVRDSLDRPYIALVSDDHKQATMKLILPGLREGDWEQVSGEGLEPGQTIVVSGAYALLFQTDIKVMNP